MKVILIFSDFANLMMKIRSIHWSEIRKWSNKTASNKSQVLLVHESDFPIITLSSPRRRVLCEKRGGYCKVLSQPVMREFEFMAPPTAQEKYFQDIGFQASHSPPAKTTHTQFSITKTLKKVGFLFFLLLHLIITLWWLVRTSWFKSRECNLANCAELESRLDSS